MKIMKHLLSILRSGEKGVTTVEYAIMLVMVALAVAASTPGLSKHVIDIFTATADKLVVPAAP